MLLSLANLLEMLNISTKTSKEIAAFFVVLLGLSSQHRLLKRYCGRTLQAIEGS
jgi:hypothetical protein